MSNTHKTVHLNQQRTPEDIVSRKVTRNLELACPNARLNYPLFCLFLQFQKSGLCLEDVGEKLTLVDLDLAGVEHLSVTKLEKDISA